MVANAGLENSAADAAGSVERRGRELRSRETGAEAIVLGVRLRRRRRQEVLSEISRMLRGGEAGAKSVYFVHAHTANLAHENAEYCEVLNGGDLVLNDGTGVRWAARWQGVALEENLVGTDLVPELLSQHWNPPLRVYLLGGEPGVAKRAERRLRTKFPYVEIVGTRAGFFTLPEEPGVVEDIREAAPDLVLVGMGNPRQEQFIDRNLRSLGCKVAMAVGGLLDHFSGDLVRASPQTRRRGLEWLQLLGQQPWKWRRYSLGIFKFLWRAWRERKPPRVSVAGATAAGVVAGSLLAALASAEGLVRLVQPQILDRYPPGLYVPSATRQYALRPHFEGIFRYPEFRSRVRINGLGFREDREFDAVSRGPRILAVGDSFTMSYSVEREKTWVARLEALLNSGGRSGGGACAVVNAGVPGYATWQEWDLLQEVEPRLAPETVLLGFFMGNDIADNADPRLPLELEGDRLISSSARQGLLPFGIRYWLATHSHLYRLLSDRKARSTASPYGNERGWEATELLLDRISRWCEARSIRLIVVLMPDQQQTGRFAAERLREQAGAAPAARVWRPAGAFAGTREGKGSSEDDGQLADRRMQELCRRAGAEAVDLLPALAAEPGLYFPQDGHWTEKGNRLAASAIYQYLVSHPNGSSRGALAKALN